MKPFKRNISKFTNHLIVFILLFAQHVKAQDPHFSQFFASPLTLNPANTGFFSGGVRASTNYRNQGAAFGTQFTTASFAADFQILDKGEDNNDVFGIGFLGLLDQSNNSGLKSNDFGISIAYTKALGTYSRLGLGFQSVLTTKKIDYNRFFFSSQFTPNGFDNSLPNGELINGLVINYPDFSTGILYTNVNDAVANWYVGASYYHFTRPTERVSSLLPIRLQPRLTLHSGLNFPVNEANRFYMSALYMNSMVAKEFILGSVFETLLNLNTESRILSGLFYRFNEAVIPYIGFHTGMFQVGATYDVNISSMKTATQSRGGFELSIVMNFIKDPNKLKIPRCINRF